LSGRILEQLLANRAQRIRNEAEDFFNFQVKRMLLFFRCAQTASIEKVSTVTGKDYNQISAAVSRNVNSVLVGGETAEQAVYEIDRVAKELLR
jgi:hypothetical protein